VSAQVRVGRRMERCHVLGPGVRAVVWVTGCRLRCRECMTPEFLAFDVGDEVPVDELTGWILGIDGIDGVTFSGGEPFEQAAALAAVADGVRAESPELTFMAFTGYTVQRLRRRGTEHQRRLLGALDLIVDGPYLPERHSDVRWRGSSNQRLHALTARAAGFAADEEPSAGVEVTVDPDGGFAIAGVPPTRGFRPHLEAQLANDGVIARTAEVSHERQS
jgi:anaerobic ribonucleoside-triphosphate reductase activating protein